MPERTIELETPAGPATLTVADQGEGRPLLLLHGIPDTAAVWRGVVDALEGQARCVCPNLPHSGRGVVSDDFTYSLESMAALITQLVDRLDVGHQIDLVVHDAGARDDDRLDLERREGMRRSGGIRPVRLAQVDKTGVRGEHPVGRRGERVLV